MVKVRDFPADPGLSFGIMTKDRFLLCSLAVLLLGWGSWYLYSGWGLVSLDVTDAPVGKVLTSIERQGGIAIASNLDPTTPVTIKVKRVPAVAALDLVANRTDSSWRLAYLGAPDDAAIKRALDGFTAGQETEGWTSHGGGGFSIIESSAGTALDLRRIVWQPAESGTLKAMLDDATQKTGVFLAAPTDWNPAATAPKTGEIRRTAPELFTQAGGSAREIFLLRGPRAGGGDRGEGGGEGRGGEGRGGGWGGGAWIGRAADRDGQGGGGPGGWMRVSPEEIAGRVEAQIALLPKEEQEKAREDFAMMRKFWDTVRDLPEEERRNKAREFFTSPEMSERMEDRRLVRDSKSTPEKRNDRSRNYFKRKEAAKAAQSSGGAAQ
jgi:hypothetical protein